MVILMNNKKSKLQPRGGQEDLKERREERALADAQSTILKLEADLLAAKSNTEDKPRGGTSAAPSKEELKALQKSLKVETRKRIELEEELAARTAAVVAPAPIAVRDTELESIQAELKAAKLRITTLLAQIETLEESSGTYKLRLTQVERELKSALENTKCKKCELNGSKPPVPAVDNSVWTKLEKKLRDYIAQLEAERTKMLKDQTAAQKRETTLQEKNNFLQVKLKLTEAGPTAKVQAAADYCTHLETEIDEVREFLDSVSGKRCCPHHAEEETLMEKVEEVWGQFETMREHMDTCASEKLSIEELGATNAAQQITIKKANEKNALKDLRIRQLEMKVTETEKSFTDARRAAAGKPPVEPVAPITPPVSPVAAKNEVPTIALSQYRELEQMKAAVDIALKNEKESSRKAKRANSSKEDASHELSETITALQAEINVLRSAPPTIVVEERIVEKIVTKLVDRPVERGANGSEMISTDAASSATEARLREAIKKMAATVSLLQGTIKTLRDENTTLLLESIGV